MHGKGLFMAGADIRSCMVGNSRMELDFPRVQNPDTASGGMKLEKKGFPVRPLPAPWHKLSRYRMCLKPKADREQFA